MKKLCVVLVLTAGCLWGLMGLFVRQFTALGFTSVQIAALRTASAAVMLVIFGLFVGGKAVFKIKLRDIGWFAGSGVLSMAGMSWCYFSSINESSMCVAAILLYTAPFIVTVASVFLFGEKFNLSKAIALVAAFSGCVLVTGIGGDITALGIIFGVGSAVCYASYSLFGKVLLKRYSPLTVTMYSFVFAAAALIIICDIPSLLSCFIATGSVAKTAFLSVLMGAESAVLPYLFYTYALVGLEAGKASVMASVEPLVAALCGFLVFDERMGLLSVLGIALIIFAVFMINDFGRKKN